MSLKKNLSSLMKDIKRLFTPKKVICIVAGTAILSFGMYNIHQQTAISEGGVLGMILLLNHWLGISSAILSPVLDCLCYLFAIKYLGRDFLKVTIVTSLSLSGFFFLWEKFPPILPDLSAQPLIAAILGGTFVGVGVGIIVRQGGSSGGDDALALVISKLSGIRLSHAYMATDFTVLFLSLTYIPFRRIAYSLVTVTISSWLIDFIKGFHWSKDAVKNAEEISET
jgi:uncharacterized membrane-anchored protein YitT (DUF2179 family)